MFAIAWAGTLVFLVLGIAVFTWIGRPGSKVRDMARDYFVGMFGEEIITRGRPKSVQPRGYLTTDPDEARAFVMDFRAPSDRVVLRHGPHAARLTDRGASIVTALVAADQRTASKARREAERGAGRDRGDRPPTQVNPDVGERASGERFLVRWLAERGPITASVGDQDATLTLEGSDIATVLLAGSHKTVDRIAVALGVEDSAGWADWLPSDRVVEVSRHDEYIDSPQDPWAFGRRPRFGGKQRRFPR